MPDTKITALAAISTVDPAADVLPIVDISDTSMAASGTTKKITSNQLLGAGGTATLASATITGDLTVDTSTLKVDSTNNRVGIGTAGPSTNLHIGSGTGGNNLGVLLSRGATTNFYEAYDGTKTAFIGTDSTQAFVKIGAFSNHPVGFVVNNGLVATLDSSGNLSLANGNLVMSTAGKGIDFSATTPDPAGMTSELLDDYEEGTFTPTVRGSTTAGTGTYTTQFGRYTKVGRLVTVSVTLVWTAHTGTGNLQFAGLPFTAANTTNAYDGISIAYQSNIASSANTVLYGLVEFGATVITMTATPVGGGTYGLVAMDTAGEIGFTATYTV